MNKSRFLCALSVFAAAVVSSCAPLNPSLQQLAPQARYVSMGSSFAAGPGIMPSADQPANRCTRSAGNYAHILAQRLNLSLVDVSCGGATTAHILGPWAELPAQVDAVTADTALVTITIGGNDVGYIGRLMASSCLADGAGPERDAAMTLCRALAAHGGTADTAAARARALTIPDQAAWTLLASQLHRINTEIARRAPRARIVYVTYVALVPDGQRCPQMPMSDADAAIARSTAMMLAETTRRIAREDGAAIVDADALSQSHHACADDGWANAFLPRAGERQSAPYHPNQRGMMGIAAALEQLLR